MTKIMGILNVTPDSFFDGGYHDTYEAAVAHGIRLSEEGADWIDVGGESARPGSERVSMEEELSRVIPVIEKLHSTISTPLSIDTMKAEVAAAAVKAGATMINDVSGFRNDAMVEVAAQTGVEVCAMHMSDTPRSMQDNPTYPGGVVETICQYLKDQATKLQKAGVAKERITLDPGIGFGKTVAQNYTILQNLEKFQVLGFSLLIGLSRKSLLSKIVGKPADSDEALAATQVMNALLIQAGVSIIRVHDVKAHREVMKALRQ